MKLKQATYETEQALAKIGIRTGAFGAFGPARFELLFKLSPSSQRVLSLMQPRSRTIGAQKSFT
jgi:hypothetical protein